VGRGPIHLDIFCSGGTVKYPDTRILEMEVSWQTREQLYTISRVVQEFRKSA
jgi:hypothetical protein